MFGADFGRLFLTLDSGYKYRGAVWTPTPQPRDAKPCLVSDVGREEFWCHQGCQKFSILL